MPRIEYSLAEIKDSELFGYLYNDLMRQISEKTLPLRLSQESGIEKCIEENGQIVLSAESFFGNDLVSDGEISPVSAVAKYKKDTLIVPAKKKLRVYESHEYSGKKPRHRGEIEVRKIAIVTVDEVTDEELMKLGVDLREELLPALQKKYPNLNQESIFAIYHVGRYTPNQKWQKSDAENNGKTAG